jgi:hypothetical protein
MADEEQWNEERQVKSNTRSATLGLDRVVFIILGIERRAKVMSSAGISQLHLVINK